MDEQLLLGNLDNDQNTLPESTQKMTLELVQNRGVLPVNMFGLIPYFYHYSRIIKGFTD
jgi:hypothetical protein